MWRKRKIEDTQPMPAISPSAIEAYKVLGKVEENRKSAENRADYVQRTSDELIERCGDNHFMQSWLSMLRQGGAR